MFFMLFVLFFVDALVFGIFFVRLLGFLCFLDIFCFVLFCFVLLVLGSALTYSELHNEAMVQKSGY